MAISYKNEIVKIIARLEQDDFKKAFSILKNLVSFHDTFRKLYLSRRIAVDYAYVEAMDSAFSYSIDVLEGLSEKSIMRKKEDVISHLESVISFADVLDKAITKKKK